LLLSDVHYFVQMQFISAHRLIISLVKTYNFSSYWL